MPPMPSSALIRLEKHVAKPDDSEADPDPPQVSVALIRRGPGLTMFQFANSGGKLINSVLNNSFRGPMGPKSKFDAFFSDEERREKALDALHKTLTGRNNLTKQHKKMRGYCQDLLKYAVPESHTADTQLVTFKILVSVITRYPGVRRLFYHPTDCKQSSSILQRLWSRRGQDCGQEWNFHRDFAIYCLSESKLTALMEGELPSGFGRLQQREDEYRVPVEELLALCRIIDFDHSRLASIRYLASTLELPNFWNVGFSNLCARETDDRDALSDFLHGLCETILKLLQDTEKGPDDADIDAQGDSPVWMSAARDAVDVLVFATFEGFRRLHNLNQIRVNRSPPNQVHPLRIPCPSQLPGIISLLKRSSMRSAFPKASSIADLINEILEYAPLKESSRVDPPNDIGGDARSAPSPVAESPARSPAASVNQDHDISNNETLPLVEQEHLGRSESIVEDNVYQHSNEGTINPGYNPVLDKIRPDAMAELLKNYQVLFVVDDSGSMHGTLWMEAKDALTGIADYAMEYDTDTLDVVFLNSTLHMEAVKGNQTILNIFNQLSPQGPTPIGQCLRAILDKYLARLDQALGTPSYASISPLSITVITDGQPSDNPAEVLLDAGRRMKGAKHHSNYISVQFVQIGDAPDVFKELQVVSGDNGIMVDIVPYSGELTSQRLERILLGFITTHK